MGLNDVFGSFRQVSDVIENAAECVFKSGASLTFSPEIHCARRYARGDQKEPNSTNASQNMKPVSL